jgi:uncharacterized membrane protein YdbT with pleckstrin-like domain
MIRQSLNKRNVSDSSLITLAGVGVIVIVTAMLLQLAAWYFVVIVLTTIFNRLNIQFDTLHTLLFLICLRFFVFWNNSTDKK